jgi:hypothetical protein
LEGHIDAILLCAEGGHGVLRAASFAYGGAAHEGRLKERIRRRQGNVEHDRRYSPDNRRREEAEEEEAPPMAPQDAATAARLG